MNKKIPMSIKNAGNRGYHLMMDIGGKALKWPKPEVVVGSGCCSQLPQIVKKCGITKVMIVTDQVTAKIAEESILPCLDETGQEYEVFSKVKPNPTDKIVEDIARAFRVSGCDGMIAVGGGSPIDAAKGALVRIARPRTPLCRMEGMFKVLKKTLPMIAVPTTSGSGSEVSLVTVIVEDATRHKFLVTDPVLVPKYAVLDPVLMTSMPKELTSTTGMDALTHAVESYLTWAYNTNQTNRYAEEAVLKVFRYLERACADGNDLEAREQMAVAACKAGMAFTRTGLGHIHAISHAISGLYNTPHGLANSVILPIVLEDYGETVYPQLAHLAEITGIRANGDDAEKARAFIGEIRAMNKRLGHPTGFDFIKNEDIPTLVKWAVHEGNYSHPSPVLYDPLRCRHVINRIIGEA